MMYFLRKPLIAHYIITAVLLGGLLFYSYRLHHYSKYDKLLVAAIQSLQNGSTPGYDANFDNNIEKQRAVAELPEANWINAFKKDSANYPQNIITHAFRTLPRLGLVLENMNWNGDTVICRLRVRDKQPFTITAKFIQKGNIFLLDDLENICALYKRLNCYNLYLNSTGQMQNLK